MSNSQVITDDFDFFSPETVEEALEKLRVDGASVLAGGTDVLNEIKTGWSAPKALVYVLGIKDLDVLEWNKGLRIGAATLWAKLEEDDRVRETYPALYDAVKSMGAVQIRNMATLPGNLCTASPGADSAPPLIALSASLELCRREGDGEIVERTLPVEEFFTGPRKTALQEGELVTAISIPEPSPSSGSAFGKIARVTLSIAKINCAVYVERDGRKCTKVRAALGGVAPRPVRGFTFEKALTGKDFTRNSVAQAVEMVNEDISPRNARSTAAYKRNAARVLLGDTLEHAWKRSGGEISR
jgi:carbon-monoxide dehydrogenase medium subunit